MFTLLLLLLAVLITQISASCSDISFSECDDFRSSGAILLAIQLPGEENCRKMCQAVGEGCKFFTFEETSYQANCQLYRQQLSNFLNHCNVLGGPKPSSEANAGSMCDYDKMKGNLILDGQCDYGTVEERFDKSKWEYCQKQCTVLESCKSWRFFKEEGKCQIIGDFQKKCQFKMGLNIPGYEPIGVDGEWKLIFRQTMPFLYKRNQFNLNIGDNGQENFAILGDFEAFRRGGKFQLKLKWPELGTENIWTQTSNPFNNPKERVTGYQSISTPYTGCWYWGGLEYNNYYALLDGSVNPSGSTWWYAVGKITKNYHGRIPGPCGVLVKKVELYAYVNKGCSTFTASSTPPLRG